MFDIVEGIDCIRLPPIFGGQISQILGNILPLFLGLNSCFREVAKSKMSRIMSWNKAPVSLPMLTLSKLIDEDKRA
ncbi:hypothetical protein D0962_03160 [Leptolyngbyaceae cyanobacterium CCMR0082]|uniref:Uncharacterized protein n=1 Tax=Adonisia turfae CCMR0082 TaxID=2304604 RepID=A0A6M0S1H5_9CYAN|nr:hypothetical protein [Adonisia turfae CCMR0082]